MNSTVASVKWSYVACSKLRFSRVQWKMIRDSCRLSFRSTPIREYLRVPYWLLFNVCPAIYAFPHFESRTNSVFDILSWSFWCSKRYLRWPEWNFSTSLAARMVFSLGQWKMIRGSCWLSFAAHPIRIYPRVPYWLFFKIYAPPPRAKIKRSELLLQLRLL